MVIKLQINGKNKFRPISLFIKSLLLIFLKDNNVNAFDFQDETIKKYIKMRQLSIFIKKTKKIKKRGLKNTML